MQKNRETVKLFHRSSFQGMLRQNGSFMYRLRTLAARPVLIACISGVDLSSLARVPRRTYLPATLKTNQRKKKNPFRDAHATNAPGGVAQTRRRARNCRSASVSSTNPAPGARDEMHTEPNLSLYRRHLTSSVSLQRNNALLLPHAHSSLDRDSKHLEKELLRPIFNHILGPIIVLVSMQSENESTLQFSFLTVSAFKQAGARELGEIVVVDAHFASDPCGDVQVARETAQLNIDIPQLFCASGSHHVRVGHRHTPHLSSRLVAVVDETETIPQDFREMKSSVKTTDTCSHNENFTRLRSSRRLDGHCSSNSLVWGVINRRNRQKQNSTNNQKSDNGKRSVRPNRHQWKHLAQPFKNRKSEIEGSVCC